MTTKRAWNLQEFVAHGAKVNCLAMGHKNGRVMVTGGEDRKVNLWMVGKPTCLMSLTGHTTPVEAVKFSSMDEMVMAGSVSGALKIWDLEAAKIMRTLTGHNSGIRDLDFHTHGDYVASCSMDTNVKLWDIRRKGCIFTYRGHTDCVNTLRFSPDGQWIASGGEDSLIKIWDLTAGKLLKELKLHAGPVNALEFHPSELLMASGSSDRTVKFWDLESFEMIGTSDVDSTPVRSITFHPDGSCLYSGVQDFLKVHIWEPNQCVDSIGVGWGKVSDMSIAQSQNQLIAASFSKSNVSTYVVDIQRLQPFGGPPSPQDSHLRGSRKSYMERPPTQSGRQSSIPKEDASEASPGSPDDQSEEKDSSADIQDPVDYAAIFQPRTRIARSPSRPNEPFQAPLDEEPPRAEPIRQPPTAEPVRHPPPRVEPVRQSPPRAEPVRQSVPKPKPEQPSPPSRKTATVRPTNESVPAKQTVSAEDFMMNSAAETPPSSSKSITVGDVINNLLKGHEPMITVMSHRGRKLQTVRAMWTSGSTKTAVDSAISMNDPAVVVDLLNVINQKPGLWNLDMCCVLLPQLKDLLTSKYESYVMTSCDALKVVLRNLGPVIKANLVAPPSMGVDISREERSRKCNVCYKNLSAIRSALEKKHDVPQKLYGTFQEIRILMDGLD